MQRITHLITRAYKPLITSVIVSAALLLFVTPTTVNARTPPVKMSSSKICHDTSSPYYERTKNFKAYDSINACLDAGGRLPKGQKVPSARSYPELNSSNDYSRSAFASWIDEDGDCLNTRHELLLELSTGPTTKSSDGCRVLRGRWNDPYSGSVFLDSSKMDIDHLVPLAWAWRNGASSWSESERDRLANDPINLFAVSASLNRSKGAQGPDSWLPPNEKFHCQYVTRFYRVLLKYEFPEAVRSRAKATVNSKC